MSAKVGSLPSPLRGNRTEINKSPATIEAELKERKRAERESMRRLVKGVRDIENAVDDRRLKKREKELAKEFRDKNGRWPNRKGEREKIRDQAWEEQMKEIRERRKKMEDIKNMKLPWEVHELLSEERRKRREEKERISRSKEPFVIQTYGGGPRLTRAGLEALDMANEMIARGGKDKEAGERIKKGILDELRGQPKTIDWGKFGIG